MHEFAHNMYYDPIEEFDRKCVQESLIEASEWFIRDSILQVDDYSELDTIINTWSFVYKAFNDKQIRENLGEKVQCVRSHTKKEWKEPGGCGKETKKINRCKNGYIIQLRSHRVGRMWGWLTWCNRSWRQLYEWLFAEVPKILRGILSVLVFKNEPQINNLAAVGYIMMGNKIIYV